MIYGVVKPSGESYEFIPDNWHVFNDVVYNAQFIAGMSKEHLAEIGLLPTQLMDIPELVGDSDGTYHFELIDGVVHYKPNYLPYVPQPVSEFDPAFPELH